MLDGIFIVIWELTVEASETTEDLSPHKLQRVFLQLLIVAKLGTKSPLLMTLHPYTT